MYIAAGQGQTTPRGQNFDVNRNLLSLRSFATSFNKISLKSDFIKFFSWFYACIQPQGRGWQPPGDKILTSTGTSCHFRHLLQVPKKSLWHPVIFRQEHPSILREAFLAMYRYVNVCKCKLISREHLRQILINNFIAVSLGKTNNCIWLNIGRKLEKYVAAQVR